MAYLKLTPHQIWELREFARGAVGRVAFRALMVIWRAEGLTTLEIAERLGCHRETVSLWIERYRSLHLVGLKDDPRSGRPPSLDGPTRDQIETLLDQPAPETDRPCAFWTLPHLRTVMSQVASKTFGIETLRRTVHQLGFRFRRPRLWAHKEDPESFEKQFVIESTKQEAIRRREAAETVGEVSPQTDEFIHFLYADATDHHLLAVLRSMWMRVGQQVRVATPPRNGKWTLFGAINAFTGAFAWQAYTKPVTASFLGFLEHVLTEYPTGTIVLVIDNASYHRSRAAVSWLRKHERVLLLYLPARRPDLNPIELIWSALKDSVSANRSFDCLLTLGQYISRYFKTLSPDDFMAQAGLRNDFSGAT